MPDAASENPAPRRVDRAGVVIAAALAVLAAVLVWDASKLPSTTMYGMARFELRTSRELARFIAAKGSVTLDGVSLTVNTVDDVGFSVLIIPHTLAVTTLSGWKAGSEVNIEVDLMARYAARLSEMK